MKVAISGLLLVAVVASVANAQVQGESDDAVCLLLRLFSD